jgi:hypothetical protein
MRFTWIALPVLLATLTAPARMTTPDEADDDERSRPPAHAAVEARPSAALPSHPVGMEEVLEVARNAGRRRVEGATTVAEESGAAPAGVAAVHLRLLRVESLDFTSRLSHAVSGCLPSYATVCPPPAA